MKLAGSSYYGASLPWVPIFGISQPCDWLTGKMMPKMISNSSLNFAVNPSKLGKPTGYLKQCVIRWFSFTSINAYQGFQVVFFANCH